MTTTTGHVCIGFTDVPTPREDLAWFAGIFEGEGWFTHSNGLLGGLRVEMTDEDTILKVQRIMGCGSVRRQQRAAENTQPSWCWSLYGDPARWLAGLITPFLSLRRLGKLVDLQP